MALELGQVIEALANSEGVELGDSLPTEARFGSMHAVQRGISVSGSREFGESSGCDSSRRVQEPLRR